MATFTPGNFDLRFHYGQVAWRPGFTLDRFKRYLRDADYLAPDVIDALVLCEDCGMPEYGEQAHTVQGVMSTARRRHPDRTVCRHCHRGMVACEGCQGRSRTLAATNDGHHWCTVCLTERYFQCRHCGWVLMGTEADHRHGADGCCTSPALEFSMSVRGEQVHAEQRFRVSIDEGKVNDTGIHEIRRLLINHAQKVGNVREPDSRAYRLYRFANRFDVGRELTSKGGNFATRVKRQAYKDYSLKLEKDLLAQIGTLASDHALGGDHWVEITRDLNRSATEFGHAGSCYWTEYNKARCSLKSNGGFGVRVFGGEDSKAVTGRCWVIPLKVDVDGALKPSFSTKTGIWFVFNGYGVLAEKGAVKLFAHMVGDLPYASVNFSTDGMYINSGSGYLVADQKVLTKQAGRLRFPLPEHSTLWEQEQKEVAA